MADSQQEKQLDPSQPPTSATYLHPRREPFEYGLLPIPKLIFTDGIQTLSHVKSTLLSSNSDRRVKPETLAEVLQIPVEHSRLLVETLASVLHDDSDPAVKARTREEIDEVGVNAFDLLVFLYVQSYKRLLPKGHKDSAAVADVWPSTSAFDGFLSVLSPIQLVRSNSRRLMPSQADEEAHQLSYLQKHLSNILSLLADVAEGEGDEAMVLSMEKFEHLGFLMYFGDKGSERIPVSQNTPFYANSDPDMPAAPVPTSQVLDWLLQNISFTLEHIADRASSKENSPGNSSDQDVAMSDISAMKPSSNLRGPSLIEAISKSSYVKQATDLKATSIKVVNCHESVIYILAPMRYATVYGCSDATIVLGAVGKAVRVEHCERVHLITAARRICIANCRECLFFLGVNQPPLLVGDNHKLQAGLSLCGFFFVAPYNTFYSQLENHLTQIGIDPNINKWDQPVVLGIVDPHDALSHPAGVSDVQAESATSLEPNQYTNFVIPSWLGSEEDGGTKDNPFPLPCPYLAAQKKNHENLEEVKQLLRETQLEESRKRELSSAIHACFKDWLYASGNIRQLYCLQGE
ncbi:Tubulin binding cofactor C domain-containing protein [Striga hermonthica]|uniref:TBCC domain-containing protein 1 n=1 Tax=Striga hermonthica TaxID=68872 RepID=A0A9N7MP51_STRHE|nr:Tubulin binding cofactor C domain-containing protein [Striga hermonthica]